MPSPFPGMNPYLEQDLVWHDFHERFVPGFAEYLGSRVDPDYVVKIDEQIYIHELAPEKRYLMGRADVALSGQPGGLSSGPAAAVVEAPAQVRLPGVDRESSSFLEIRDRANWKLITVIELLSPSNKYAGPDREQYLGKRANLLHGNVHLVEIDLLRGGPRLPLEELPACDYCVLVSRWEDRPRAGLWPIRLRERLPVVPIPLRAPSADVRVDLQEVLDQVYDRACYDRWIYAGQPQPALNPDDAAWARSFLPVPG